MTYREALCEAMSLCAADPRVVFMGQAVACEGTAMSGTLAHIAIERRVELPVAEAMQMGMAIGASLAGLVPVTCYPRFNFLLLACDMLVNHLDKLPLYGNGYAPHVIIRTAVATDEPMNPGPQHLGNFSLAFRNMCKTVWIEELTGSDQVVPAYRRAMERGGASLLVEFTGMYDA